ncbi:hypothetical protein [Paenibacillus lautus]|uniref:hypothetical protein n=1 Tax=Paenibacillus lautus TaxID=1401 RepID=UPI003D29552F
MAKGNQTFSGSLGVVGGFGFIKYNTDPFGGSFNGQLMPRLLTSVNVAVLECYEGLKKEINEKYKKGAHSQGAFFGKDNSYYFRSNHTSMNDKAC